MTTEGQALPLGNGKCGPHGFRRADMPPTPSSHGISRGLTQLPESSHVSHMWSRGIFLKLIALRFHEIALCQTQALPQSRTDTYMIPFRLCQRYGKLRAAPKSHKWVPGTKNTLKIALNWQKKGLHMIVMKAISYISLNAKV